ncbi:MAG: hypothetical protein OK474_07895 [Thaumarchaeota archaeon]|nr:hypothetical protein [Nitrososphaerota archaeon]
MKAMPTSWAAKISATIRPLELLDKHPCLATVGAHGSRTQVLYSTIS